MRSMTAATAYKRAATFRSIREQEADVFYRVNAKLKLAAEGGPLDRTKALADNERLWLTLTDLMRDPDNPLPPPLRASIVSVGNTVRQEAKRPDPDLGFLINVNEQIAAGLSSSRDG